MTSYKYGKGASDFCDTMQKGKSKKAILQYQKGKKNPEFV